MPLASTRTLHRGHALDKSRLLHACLKHALPNHPSVSGDRLPCIDVVKQHPQMTGESDNIACHGEADLSRSPLHYSISCEFVLRVKPRSTSLEERLPISRRRLGLCAAVCRRPRVRTSNIALLGPRIANSSAAARR